MNYIRLSKDSIVSVESKQGSKLEYSIRSAIYLAKQLNGSVELKHQSGEYLIDSNGQVDVLKGEEPNRKLLPVIYKDLR